MREKASCMNANTERGTMGLASWWMREITRGGRQWRL